MILLGAGLVTLPGVTNGRLDPRGLMWLLPSPVIYAFYLAASAVLLRRHPPVVGAGFLYLGLALVFLAAGSVLGIEVPATKGAWLLILFIALGPGALTVTLFSYSVPRLGAVELRDHRQYGVADRRRDRRVVARRARSPRRARSAGR